MSLEFNMIQCYFAHLGVSKKEVLLGVGDDAALLQSALPLAISTDTLISGVHFPENTSAIAIAYKALAVSLSDLAAMGASPVAFTLNLSLPHVDKQWLKSFTAGLNLLSKTFHLSLIGGDSTRSPLLMLAITIFGHCQKPLCRNQAQVGDSIWVSGTLGDAALGLAVALQKPEVSGLSKKEQQYLLQRLDYPRPRIPLALALTQEIHAAIDISDGFLADLGHILTASQCAAEVFLEKLPLSFAYRQWQKNTVSVVPALTGGDDYELCFTAPESATENILNTAKTLGVPCAAVGSIKAGIGLQVLYRDQPIALPEILGFQHW